MPLGSPSPPWEDSCTQLTQMQGRVSSGLGQSINKVCQGSKQGGIESEEGHTEMMSSLPNPHLWQTGLHSGPWPGGEPSSGNTSGMAWPGSPTRGVPLPYLPP